MNMKKHIIFFAMALLACFPAIAQNNSDQKINKKNLVIK